MPSSLMPLAEDVVHHLPVPPYVIGITIFVVLCAAMGALLIFGKGRPHA